MIHLPKKRLFRVTALATVGVILILVLGVIAVVAAQKFCGGLHVTLAGESYGFKIGMTKEEVFQKYRELDELSNIRAYESGGLEHYPIASKPAELLMDSTFASSAHWMAYRKKWPIWYQEFFFADNKLTNITTFIRFYETP